MAFHTAAIDVEDVKAQHISSIERALVERLKVYGATLAPYVGALYFRDCGEVKRQEFDGWLHTWGAFEAVVDFDAAVRDAAEPSKFREDYQSGDWLHPSDVGYRAMAQAIDLTLFDQ